MQPGMPIVHGIMDRLKEPAAVPMSPAIGHALRAKMVGNVTGWNTGQRSTYFAANETFPEVPKLMDSHAIDPLRTFSEECRAELQAL
jgi:hypothetical protein